MQDSQPLSSFRKRSANASFTLVEMLVATGILVVILTVVVELTGQVARIWRSSTSRIQTFQAARTGFEALTRKLGQATLNTYYDYYDTNNGPGTYFLRTTANSATFVPGTYDRVSDLHFISGQSATLLTNSPTAITTQTHAVFFQAPLGYSVSYQALDNSLNACGYFLQFDAAASSIPAYITNSPGYTPRYRYRLMEMMQPTENLSVYFGTPNSAWFYSNVGSNSRVLAENVIALVVLPELPTLSDATGTNLAPNYNYNSRVPLGATSDTNWPSASPAFPPDAFATVTTTSTNTATVTMTRHNQLPPLVHVVMVVIDEPSALRLQGASTNVPTAINLAGVNPPLFTSSANLSNDLQSVQDVCNATPGNVTGNTTRLNYRIFYSDVILHGAKWSNN